jgi:YjbE family integral membrane protein
VQGPELGQMLDGVVRFLSITVIDLALSGDNAIVIGMAAASLERRQRRWAILGGAALAIVLRVLLTTIASVLLLVPMLSVVGGAVLLWVAWKLLRMDVEGGEADQPAAGRDMSRLRDAILVIVVADVTMSLDNVIAVAGSAHGSAILIVLGLLISMPLLMVTGGVVSLIIDRFKGLVYLGAGVICFTGIRMILEDRVVEPQLAIDPLVATVVAAAGGLALMAVFIVLGRQLTERRLQVVTEDPDRP